MAEDKLSLHIDTDWKKQAQEEKKKLVEQAAAAKAAAPATSAPAVSSPSAARSPAAAARGDAAGTRSRETPPATFSTLVQSIMTQVLYYLGELEMRAANSVNLDMAKNQMDILSLLEVKTANNLSEDETRVLDAALYETRMRFVNVASQYL